MLFRRREELSYWQRFKLWMWPRVSFRRSGLYYLKRILRLSGSPYAIAMGSAVGAAVAFTPFIGLHLLLTFAIAWILRGNMIAGVISGAFFGNPLTYPLIWAGTYELGRLVLDHEAQSAPARFEHDLLDKSWDQLWPIVKPLAIGSVPAGLAAGALVFLLVYKALIAYRENRSQRLVGRRSAESFPAE